MCYCCKGIFDSVVQYVDIVCIWKVILDMISAGVTSSLKICSSTFQFMCQRLLNWKLQNISTGLKAVQLATSLWLFDHCCQHAEIRGEGYNPSVGLKVYIVLPL